MIGADAIRGRIDLILLAILEEAPSDANEISRLLTERSHREYSIEQTTLYPALKRLEGQALLAAREDLSPSGRPRTSYSLTVEGREQLAAERAEWRSTRALVDRFMEGTTPP